MAVRTGTEYNHFEGQEGVPHPFLIAPDIETPNKDRFLQLKRLRTATTGAALRIVDSTGSAYLRYISLYHRAIPSETARIMINTASAPILGIAIITGVVALGQANGLDQPKPKAERVTTPAKGPTSIDDCEAFSAGDDMFHACMERRERLKQTMTP